MVIGNREALQRQLADVHGFEQLMQDRKLRTKLFSGRRAARFVLPVFQVAEGRPVQVKRDRQVIRLFLADYLEEHGQEAIDRIGILAIVGVHQRQRVKRAMHQTVAVHQHHFFRHAHCLPQSKYLYTPYYTRNRRETQRF